MPSPEVEQIAAYQAGRDAAQLGRPVTGNPFAAQLSYVQILQFQSWLAGWTSIAAREQTIGPLFTPIFELSRAQLLAANVTPVSIAPGIPNYIYWPVATQISKPLQTTGYTVGGSLFQLGWENLAGLAFFSSPNAGLLDQVSAQERAGQGQFSTAGGALASNVNLLTQAKPGVPMVARITGGAVTGGSVNGVLRGRVGFYLFPASL